MAALNPIKPLYSASATATNGSAIINVTGNVDCSWLKPGSIVQLGTRQLVDAVSGTAPDGSGNSTITLRRNWADPTTTAPLLAFMSWEGLADVVVKLRAIAEANESALQGAFSFLGGWDASPGDYPPAPAENTGTQMYRISVAGTMGGRAYRVGEPIYYDQFTSQWRSFFDLASAFSTGLLAGADAAAWRTALGLVKTTSATDTTAGRLLQVGAGGAQLGADVYRRANILGAVSQSGGVPTGAIIQRGSNASGEYTLFADGTGIATRNYTLSTAQAASTALAGGFRTGAVSGISLPFSFANTSFSVLAKRVSGDSCFDLTGAPSTTNTIILVYSRITSGDVDTGVQASILAIGRWF